MLALTSCEDFLDSENYSGKDSSNFPKTENDVNQMIASVYEASFYQPFKNNDVGQYLTWANLASDDMYGGGGSDDKPTQALDHFMFNNNTQMESLWKAAYMAIDRANSALAAVDNVADEDLRNQSKGELLFMRAFNYFDLVKCFGYIPMVESAPANVEEAQTAPEQVQPEVVYSKIGADLKEAWEIMPSYAYDGWNKLAYGKVSKWAAGALLWVAGALEAAGAFGGKVGVYYFRYVKPLDTAMLESIAGRCRTIVTIEDGSIIIRSGDDGIHSDAAVAVSGGTILPYVVQPGDNLQTIAAKYHVTPEQLAKWNDLGNTNNVQAGQQLKIKF